MTRAEPVLPKRVPITCWRCGVDCQPAFDLISLPRRTVPVCKGGCVPTVVPPRKEAP